MRAHNVIYAYVGAGALLSCCASIVYTLIQYNVANAATTSHQNGLKVLPPQHNLHNSLHIQRPTTSIRSTSTTTTQRRQRISKRSIDSTKNNSNNNNNDNYNNNNNNVASTITTENELHNNIVPDRTLRRRLLGFRCDHVKHVTADGITTLDADKPVQLTLFGEDFTKDTLVAFTLELSGPNHDCTDNDRIVSYRLRDADIITPNIAQLTVTLPAPPIVAYTSTPPAVNYHINRDDSMKTNSNEDAVNNQKQQQQYYYFCIKYAPRQTQVQSQQVVHNSQIVAIKTNANNNSNDDDRQSSFFIDGDANKPIAATTTNWTQHDWDWWRNVSASSATFSSQEFEPWVHQGSFWWLTLAVEQPMVTVSYEVLLIIILLLLSAVTSGLNLGLMSLDMNELAVIRSCGSETEKSFAKTIEPLRKRGNYLLCSLLLGNVLVNSSLTVILEDLSSGLVAVIGSTIAIVVLGEIVPQAFCSRHGLAIGARTVILTYAFMLVTFPLSYPISKLLDWMLGEEIGNCYDRERLMEFIRITGHQSRLDNDEVAIIAGALKLKKINVSEIMTRLEDVFMLPHEAQLDLATIQQILAKGYSRVPIYENQDRHQVCGLLLARDLALIDARDTVPISEYLNHYRHPLIYLDDDVTLDVALNEFKTGKSHMAIVRQIYDDGDLDRYYEATGVVTLEDVVEEVLQVEINDETDTLSDNRRKKRRNTTNLNNQTGTNDQQIILAPFVSKARNTT